jgi:hypothetical protein
MLVNRDRGGLMVEKEAKPGRCTALLQIKNFDRPHSDRVHYWAC